MKKVLAVVLAVLFAVVCSAMLFADDGQGFDKGGFNKGGFHKGWGGHCGFNGPFSAKAILGMAAELNLTSPT